MRGGAGQVRRPVLSVPPMPSAGARRLGPVLGLWLTFSGASLGIVTKNGGLADFALYAGALLALLAWVAWRVLPHLDAILPARHVRRLALASFAALALLFAVAYPIVQSGTYGAGSDGDEALEIAVRELLAGRYPYAVRTYLGNPISPLPGSLLLGAPFVLLGSGALQNLFWLLVLFVAVGRRLGDERWALLLLWLLWSTPAFLHKFVTGYDYVANSLFVLLFAWGLIRAAPERGGLRWAAALALGVALSSRANFLLLAPLVYTQLVQRAGWRMATGLGAAVAASFAAITLPFYLHDPAGFTPLHTSNKIEQYSGVLAHASLWVGGGSGLLAMLLARPAWNRSLAAFFRNCAWVQAFPIACAVLLSSRVDGLAALSQDLAFYGDFFLYFGALGAWLALHERIAGARSTALAQMAPAQAP